MTKKIHISATNNTQNFLKKLLVVLMVFGYN